MFKIKDIKVGKEKEKKIKFCPNCGSKNIDMISIGGIPQHNYVCRDCNFVASIFPEANDKTIKKIIKNNK